MRDLSFWRNAIVLGACCSILSLAAPAAAEAPPPAAPMPAPVAPAVPAAAPAPPPSAMPPAALPPPGYAYPPPPPGYTYAYPPPPPGYTYAYPAPGGRAIRAPDSVPYDGGPVAPGFHVETRPRRGLVIAGALVLGIPWALGLSVASFSNFSNQSGWLVIPALGPWITLAARKNQTCTTFNGSSFDTCYDNGENAATRTFLVLDGLMQVSGAVMLIAGITSPKKVIARDFVGSLHLTPAPVGKHGYGGFISGEF